MTIYYAGTSLADLHGSVGCVVTTSGTNIDTTYVREGILFPGDAAGAARVDFTALAEGWIHYRLCVPTIANIASLNGQLWKLYSQGFSTAQPLFQLDYDTNSGTTSVALGYGVIEYWDGAVLVEGNAETTTGLAVTTQHNIDIHFKMDNTVGYIVQYVDGAEVCRFDGDTIRTAATTLDRVEFCSPFPSVTGTASEIIIADEDTRGMRVVSLAPTGNGANTAWTGAFGDVDETGLGDADYITSAAANDIETYVIGDIAGGLAGYDVLAVVASARARKGTTGPLNLQGAVRISTTNYFSANVSGLDTGYGPVQAIWTQSPATSSNWTQAEVNGLELGLKSIT